MLYREIIAVCSEIHTKHINTLCGQNVEFVNVKPGGTWSDRWALEVWHSFAENQSAHCRHPAVIEQWRNLSIFIFSPTDRKSNRNTRSHHLHVKGHWRSNQTRFPPFHQQQGASIPAPPTPGAHPLTAFVRSSCTLLNLTRFTQMFIIIFTFLVMAIHKRRVFIYPAPHINSLA
jgi:hypothetical protein